MRQHEWPDDGSHSRCAGLIAGAASRLFARHPAGDVIRPASAVRQLHPLSQSLSVSVSGGPALDGENGSDLAAKAPENRHGRTGPGSAMAAIGVQPPKGTAPLS